jgi:hypothetical protein
VTTPLPFAVLYVTESVLSLVPAPVETKLASTTSLAPALSAKVQEPLPLHAPLQLSNDHPLAGVSVSVMFPPLGKVT